MKRDPLSVVVKVHRMYTGLPVWDWTIMVTSRWPTRVHRIFTPEEPLEVAGLLFYTHTFTASKDGALVELRQLRPVRKKRGAQR